MTLEYESTTTLRRIREASPCQEGWEKLLKHLGKTKADDEPLALEVVLDSNGFDDALWVLSYAMADSRLARHFQAWCVEQVVHLFEAARPDDDRVRKRIDILRNNAESKDVRVAAWSAREAAWISALAAQEKQLRTMMKARAI